MYSKSVAEKDLGFDLLAVILLGQQDSLDVGEDTTAGDGDSSKKLVQLLVVSDSQLQMSRDDPRFLVVTGSVTSQLENLSRKVLQDSSQVDWSSATNTVSIVSFPQVSVNTTDRELESSSEGSCLGLSLGFASFSSSRHVDSSSSRYVCFFVNRLLNRMLRARTSLYTSKPDLIAKNFDQSDCAICKTDDLNPAC